MRPLPSVLVLIVLACVPAARAQSVYVDFEPVGSPVGTAPATYGGPAVAPGVWNAVSASSAAGLVAADGSPSSVGLVLASVVAPAFGSDNHASGADEPLVDDYVLFDTFLATLDVSGLSSGEYVVHTIHVECHNVFAIEISVSGSPDPPQYCGGGWSGGYVLGSGSSFDQAGNYARHAALVSGGTLRVDVTVSGLTDVPCLRGVQLVRIDEHAEPLCFGDGSAPTPCPCANQGAAGRGCASSASSAGARLYATGTSVPDVLGLHAEDVPATALSIVLQGNASIPATTFGDGLRCTGGQLLRLYVENAFQGLVHAPQPGDPSVSARSAALGDPIPPGERRYYQVYYRDPDPAFCPEPAGSTFNVTNALKVDW
jgi:hypothetical protein